VVELKAKSCSGCQADLKDRLAELVNVIQITELPEAKAQVIEVRQYGVTCQQCGHIEIMLPEGLEMDRSFWGAPGDHSNLLSTRTADEL
jgi:hypothetical protein